MRILALDAATRTGWAAGDTTRDPLLLESGVEVFDIRRGESTGLRFLRFRTWLYEIGDLWLPELVVFEQAHHRGGAPTELGVGLTTRVQEFAAERRIEHAAVHTGTLKKHATGRGNAEKPAMIEAARRRWNVEPIDDNHADALCLLAYGIEVYGGGGKGKAA